MSCSGFWMIDTKLAPQTHRQVCQSPLLAENQTELQSFKTSYEAQISPPAGKRRPFIVSFGSSRPLNSSHVRCLILAVASRRRISLRTRYLRLYAKASQGLPS